MKENAGIKTVGLEIKKIGISMMQGWDVNVKHSLQVHKNILDNLFSRLELSMRKSLRKFDYIISYFQ